MATPDPNSAWMETPLQQSGAQNTPPALPSPTQPQSSGQSGDWQETPIQSQATTGDAAITAGAQEKDSPSKGLTGLYNTTVGPLASLAKSSYEYYKSKGLEGILDNVDPAMMLKDAIKDENNPLHIVAKGMAQAHMQEAQRTKDLYQRAVQAAREGKADLASTLLSATEVGGHGLATLLPMVGPAAAQAGEKIGTGHPWEGAGEATGLIAGALTHPAIAKARGVLGEGLANAVRPEMQDTASGAQIPVRNTSRIGQIAAQAVDKEIPARLTAQQTAPAVAKGIGTVAARASEAGGKASAYNGIFKTAEEATNPTATDRFGLRAHADNLYNNQAKPVYQALDEASDGEFTKAQNDMDKYRYHDPDKFEEAQNRKQAIIDQNTERLKAQGLDPADADAAYRKKVALEKVANKLDQATGPAEVEGTDYSISGKKLAKAFDDLVKKGDNNSSVLTRAGFTDEHIAQVRELANILKDQEKVPQVSMFVKGIARGAIALTGLSRGGIVGAAEALTGESMAEKVGQKVANRVFGQAMTDPAVAKDLAQGLKSGDAEPFLDKIKNAPWFQNIADTAKNLWSNERGEAGAPGSVPLAEGKTAAQSADDYNASKGRGNVRQIEPEVHPQGREIADAFENMKHDPNDPAVKASYDSLKNGVDEQWDHATADGFKFEPWNKEGQPYANSKEMKADVDQNKHLYFFRGGDLPADHPLAEVDPKTGLTYNEKMRAIHDLYGHAASGYEFGPKGEEAAYKTHAQMFDRDAIPALTSETRGQNNWVNFGKHLRDESGNIAKKGEPGYVSPYDRPYAENKAGLLPDEFHGEKPEEAIAKMHNDGGGSTYNPAKGNMAGSDAYAVPTHPELSRTIEGEKVTPAQIKKFMDEPKVKQALTADPSLSVGTWANDGKTYLDLSSTIPDRDEAVALGAKNNQKAITYLKTREDIPVGGSGTGTPLEAGSPEYKNLGDGTHEVKTAINGEPGGYLFAKDTGVPGESQIKSHWVAQESQGKGIGSSQLEQMAKSLAEDPSKRTLLSDDEMTDSAVGSWRKLQTKYPQAVSEYEGANGEPRFRFDLTKLRPEDATADEVGTMRPKGAKISDVHDPSKIVGKDTVEDIASKNPKFAEKLAASISKYNGVPLDEADYSNPMKVINKFTDQMASNIRYMYDQVPDSIKTPARKWYQSANTSIVKPWAEQYGYEPKQVAGAIAALSPQNPWENNVGVVKEILDTLKDKQNHEWTDNMETQGLSLSKGNPELRKIYKSIRGKTLSELHEPIEQAYWIRLLDETEGAGKNNLYSPEGNIVGVDDRARAWSSLDNIAKALRILDDGSMQSIHENLGYGHKVRNFYNNLVNPNSTNGHVTIDTHAVTAAHMQPFGGIDPEVAHNFDSSPKGTPKAPKSQPAGLVSSTYPLYTEAYRRVAQELGIPVHELQSTVWEGARSLFGNKKGPEVGLVKGVWQDYKDGKISLDDARQKTIQYSGGFKKPNWMDQSAWDKSEGTDFDFGGNHE